MGMSTAAKRSTYSRHENTTVGENVSLTLTQAAAQPAVIHQASTRLGSGCDSAIQSSIVFYEEKTQTVCYLCLAERR
jgi:hypothetical protein